MVNELNKNHIIAYNELLEKIPHLRVKIESGNLFNNDINTIARSVFVQEMDNGSFSIEKKISGEDKERYSKTPHNQLTLIRKICSVGKMQQSEIQALFNQKAEDNSQVPSEKNKKESVDIVRKQNKRNASEEDVRETKKRKLEDPNDLHKELIDILVNVPNGIEKIIIDSIGKLPSVTKHIVDIIRNGEDLNIESETTQLDLSEEKYINLVRKEFQKIATTLKNLKSLTLPINATEWWLKDISEHCSQLESLALGGGPEIFKDFDIIKNLKELKSLTINGRNFFPDATSLYLNLSFLSNHSDLVDLSLPGCRYLCNVDVFDKLPALKSLNLSESAMKNFNFLKNCTSLEHLDISRNLHFNNIEALGNLTALKSLNLSYCRSLDISVLIHCQALESINLTGCIDLQNIGVIERLPNLKNILLP